MSLWTPGLQDRSRIPRDWGNYPDALSLPNATGAPLSAPKFALEEGDRAFVTGVGLFQCFAPGLPGDGLAIWAQVGGAVPPIRNWVFVGKNGVDAPSSDGSLANPYLTVAYALTQIPTIGPIAPSPNNRWCVFVAAGRYNETLPINLRANVMICGSHWMATRIAAPSWGLDGDFAPAGDHRSGVQNAAISGNCVWDFNAIGSNEGKLYFDNVWLQSQVDITAFSPIQQYFFDNCLTFAAFSVNGGQFHPRNCFFQALTTFNSGPTDPANVFVDDHSSYAAGLTITKTGANPIFSVQLLGSSVVGVLSATGVFVVQATGDALPPKASVVLAGGASLLYLTDAFGTGYTPSTPGNWAPVPVEVASALDQLAARTNSSTPDRRNHSVNGGACDDFTKTPCILRTNTTVNLAGAYNGGGVGNKGIVGHWLSAPLLLSALVSVELIYERITPEIVGTTSLPYLNLIVELDPVGFPGVLSVLPFGDESNFALNLGTYTTPAVGQRKIAWTPGANFIQCVVDKGMGPPNAGPPSPTAGPATIPVSEGPPQPASWPSHDYSVANLLIAYPNARIVNGSSGDGGLPKATPTAGLLAILGDSTNVLQNAVRVLSWKLNGADI